MLPARCLADAGRAAPAQLCLPWQGAVGRAPVGSCHCTRFSASFGCAIAIQTIGISSNLLKQGMKTVFYDY